MKLSTVTINLLAAGLLMLSASSTWANLAGNVVRVKGDASTVSAKGQNHALSAGSEVSEGDTIQVASNSAIQIQMKDGALLALSGESALKIMSYNFEEANGDADSVKMELQKGRLRTITGSVPKAAYTLSTPVGVVTIQGTTYDLLVDNKGMVTILRDGAVTVRTSCDGALGGLTQLLDVPGMATAISAICKDPKKPYLFEGDTSDLDEILSNKPNKTKTPDIIKYTPSSSSSP